MLVHGTNHLTGCTLGVSLNFVSALSNQFILIDNDGTDPITGTFNGRPEGATLAVGGEQFRISYVGGTGNDVVLTQLTASSLVPPPLTIQSISASAVRLLWPASLTGFLVETNGDLSTTNWAFSPQSIVIDGTNHVTTNSTAAPQLFFRLKQNRAIKH